MNYSIDSSQPHRSWSVEQWLHVLENRHCQEIQLGLGRIGQVAGQLDLLKPRAKVITVAGTNGKGSTVEALQSVYMAAGYRVGSYTSPHLLVFNERIRVNGLPISDPCLAQALCVIEEGRGEIHLTYFEMTTLAALYYFSQCSLDIIILEVGIGGRLDATNIIDADLAIITTIDFDHQNYLGDTLEEIGYEKAGILKQGIPLIYADRYPPASVINQAISLSCPFFVKDQHYHYQYDEGGFTFIIGKDALVVGLPHLHGNAIAAAIMAVRILDIDLPVSVEQLRAGINQARLAGRLQLVQTGNHSVLLDVSHNAQAAARLASHIEQNYKDYIIHVVFSALADKDIAAMIAPLKNKTSYWYPALLTGKRAASEEQLRSAFTNHAIDDIFCHNSPLAAYEAACNRLTANDLIVVFGSFLTVCDVMPAVLSHQELRS